MERASAGDITENNVYEDEHGRIVVRDDHIVEIHLLPRGYSRRDVNLVIDRIRSMRQTDQLLVLILAHPKSSVTPGGIGQLFSRKSLNYSVAKAYVIHKPVHFLLSKIMMALHRPNTPIRFFKDRASAETWLKSLMGYGL